jgi:hypothetical protein
MPSGRTEPRYFLNERERERMTANQTYNEFVGWQVVAFLRSKGATVKSNMDELGAELLNAVAKNDLDNVQRLIRAGVDPNYKVCASFNSKIGTMTRKFVFN